MVAVNDVLIAARREIAEARADGGRGGDYADGLARGLSLGRAVSHDEEREDVAICDWGCESHADGEFCVPVFCGYCGYNHPSKYCASSEAQREGAGAVIGLG